MGHHPCSKACLDWICLHPRCRQRAVEAQPAEHLMREAIRGNQRQSEAIRGNQGSTLARFIAPDEGGNQ